MRTYYIYRQQSKLVDVHCEYSLYRWLPFEYVGYVEGTRELYEIFKRKYFRGVLYPTCVNSFVYDTKLFKRKFSFWDVHNSEPLTRFIIVDDKGNIRDFHELTDKYKKKYRYISRHNAYQAHWIHNMNELRQSITPMEIKEIKDEYGITLNPIKPNRKTDPWCFSEYHKRSKGWKEQTKRKRQYKPKEMN